MRLPFSLILGLLLLDSRTTLQAETSPADAASPTAEKSVEQLAAEAKQAVVVVTIRGRDGDQQGLGSGVIFDPSGFIATNLHVIGEARPILVRLKDGREFEVQSIHATERSQDLAILKIEAENLPALPLGDSDQVQDGQAVVAIGNPLGLEHSVVAGVLSGRREIEGRPMLQVAIPIERGNSGGPLLDRQGRVLGLLTIKSLKSDNLGFAVPINALRPLIENPNPIAMNRWLTIGVLDAEDWTVFPGGRWRQRAGKIFVEGRGPGIGGRALCLSNVATPEVPFEISVRVKYGPEDGAAGLVFHADGGDKHYGFYPSNGELRLSRFDGADVYAWQVLQQVRSPKLNSSGWNTLKVRVEADRFVCSLNGEQVIESRDRTYHVGKVGLCKFRQTEAEFQGFQVGASLPLEMQVAKLSDAQQQLITNLPLNQAAPQNLVEQLSSDLTLQHSMLESAAKHHEQQAQRLRELSADIHRVRIQRELHNLLEKSDPEVDLLRAALLIAKLDNAELDVEAYVRDVDKIVKRIQADLPANAEVTQKIAALDRVLFEEQGYHGSRTDYHNPSNSYLNEVLDDREGLPITLSLLYMEVGRRLGLQIEGVGLPGHFVVRFVAPTGEPQLIDVFERGKRLSILEAQAKVHALNNGPWLEEYLATQPPKAILQRMLRNLFGLARDQRQVDAMYRYVDTLLMLTPESSQDHFVRAVLAFQTNRLPQSEQDLQWLLERQPQDVDLRIVEELARTVARALAAKP